MSISSTSTTAGSFGTLTLHGTRSPPFSINRAASATLPPKTSTEVSVCDDELLCCVEVDADALPLKNVP